MKLAESFQRASLARKRRNWRLVPKIAVRDIAAAREREIYIQRVPARNGTCRVYDRARSRERLALSYDDSSTLFDIVGKHRGIQASSGRCQIKLARSRSLLRLPDPVALASPTLVAYCCNCSKRLEKCRSARLSPTDHRITPPLPPLSPPN